MLKIKTVTDKVFVTDGFQRVYESSLKTKEGFMIDYSKPKEYSATISVPIDFFKKGIAVKTALANALDCSEHLAVYAFHHAFGENNKGYKLYRRGKNRCRRCGVKI